MVVEQVRITTTCIILIDTTMTMDSMPWDAASMTLIIHVWFTTSTTVTAMAAGTDLTIAQDGALAGILGQDGM